MGSFCKKRCDLSSSLGKCRGTSTTVEAEAKRYTTELQGFARIRHEGMQGKEIAENARIKVQSAKLRNPKVVGMAGLIVALAATFSLDVVGEQVLREIRVFIYV